jgi:hypothetical protein
MINAQNIKIMGTIATIADIIERVDNLRPGHTNYLFLSVYNYNTSSLGMFYILFYRHRPLTTHERFY